MPKPGRSPRLETILMVERFLESASGKYSRFQIWRMLPKAVSYQTLTTILSYLEQSGKISADSKRKIFWHSTYKPNPSEKELQVGRGPRLETILMVERFLADHSGQFTRFRVWKLLPRAMMYQTFQVILAYLEASNKIVVDNDGKIRWIASKRTSAVKGGAPA